jgi:hypothetical protein
MTNTDPALRDVLNDQRKELCLIIRPSASSHQLQKSKHDRYGRGSAK